MAVGARRAQVQGPGAGESRRVQVSIQRTLLAALLHNTLLGLGQGSAAFFVLLVDLAALVGVHRG